MGRTRIAVAGAGAIGQAHMQAARSSARCLLSAVVDPAPAARARAGEFGVPCFASIDELIAKDRPDGMILATPNALHVEHALTCIAAGLPMLIEKPVAPSVADARRLIAVADACGARILVGHHRAHSPIMAKARQVVDSGVLGKLVAVTGSAMFHKPDAYFEEAPWRRQRGGGPILLNLVHEIHSLRMLCGEIVAVQALASNAVRDFEVEDTVAIGLRFASGALGSFMLCDSAASARSWEQTSRENPAYAASNDEDCYLVAGTHGSLAIPTLRLKTYGRDTGRSWFEPFESTVVEVQREDPLARQLEHFGAVVRGEVQPLVSARDGLANLRVTEAIAQAARADATVEFA